MEGQEIQERGNKSLITNEEFSPLREGDRRGDDQTDVLMLIRPYQDHDQAAVRRLLDQSWPNDPVMRELHDLHGPTHISGWQQTLIAEADGQVVGAGTVRHGERHPVRYWLILNVTPAWRRRGIGSRLFTALAALTRHDPRPFRVQARPSDTPTMQFLQQRGFRPLIRTWEGTIDPRDGEVQRRLAGLARGVEHFRLERPRGEALDASRVDLARFYAAWYRAIHTWDTPAPWSDEQAVEHFCGEDLIAESVVCAYRDVHLVGAGSLIAPPLNSHPDELYLVQVGTLGVEGDDAHALTAALIADLVACAARVEKIISFEVDNAYVELWRVIEALPLASGDQNFMVLANGPGT